MEKTTKICTLHPTLFRGLNRENLLDWACSTYGREKRCTQAFGGGKLWEREHLEDPGVDGRKILKRIFRKCHVRV